MKNLQIYWCIEGAENQIFYTSKRDFWVFSFKISLTPPLQYKNQKTKNLIKKSEGVKKYPLIFQFYLVTIPLISMPLRIFSTEMKAR